MLKKEWKKQSVLQFAALLFATAFAIFALACEGNELINTGGKPDTNALEAKIAEAESAKTGVLEDTDAANVPVGTYWVTKAVMDTFKDAIDAAKLAKSAKTQAEVDAAVTTLTAAITTFNTAKKPGTKTTLITTALTEAITKAHNAKSGVEVDTDAANVALGAPWVTRAEMTALENAIALAEQALTASTQAAVDAAASALEAAIAIFNTAKQKTGTKISGFTAEQLEELIAQAIAAKTGVVVNTDAANVAQGTSWVPQAEMTALENAITAAQGASGNIDSVYLALSNALTSFSNALGVGTKINFDQLIAEIANAEAAKVGVVVETSAANVDDGVHWVTQTVMDTFNSAIATAESALTASTQAAVDTAVTTLSAAIATFTGARGTGTKAAPTTIDYGTTLSWGNAYSPTALGLTPGKTTTELNLNWLTGGGTSLTGKVASVRFIEGTRSAGYALIEKDGTVATATSASSIYHAVTVTGLVPGKSYQYSVSDNGTNWSQMYDYKVPAATGTWKFAVISDPQLTTTNVDPNSRYPSATTTTAAGWLETMAKVAAADVSFIVSCGDQVDALGGNVTEYNNFFAPPGLRSLPLAPVVGNHDTATHVRYYYNLPNDPNARNSDTSLLGNYYYLYNNILFVGLNTSAGPNSRSAATTYITRFENTIKAAVAAHAGKYDWLIVQHHKSTASVAEHLADADIQYYVEAGFERVMSEQNVDFVLAGHDHVYARSYPLAGKDQGLVSVPNKTFPAASGSTWNNPGNPVYLTFTTASGLKYYKVSADPYFAYNSELYNKNNAVYPYLGESTDDYRSTYFGSNEYMNNKRMPVSNAAFVQPYIPSYSVVEVSNSPTGARSITFRTYPIVTRSGTSPGASQAYSFNADTPYDSITVTK